MDDKSEVLECVDFDVFFAFCITKMRSTMSDFTTKKGTPTAEEYLAATEIELLDRLNRNPSGNQSEFPFIQSVIAVRTAESQRKTNEALVLQTSRLVYATLAVCAATILALITTSLCN
jgi:hypothetical protein